MREIKFRAWDKYTSKMINDVLYLQDQQSNSFGNVLLDATNIVMQFTGLKDKNGKEIYEGDIVEFAGYKRNYIEVIEWDNIAKHTSFGGGTHNARVLGNIYENPELLNK